MYLLFVILTLFTDSALIFIFPSALTFPPAISASVMFAKLTNLTPTPAETPPAAIFLLSNDKVSTDSPFSLIPFKTVSEFRLMSSVVSKLPLTLAIAPVLSLEDVVTLNLPSPAGFSTVLSSVVVALSYCNCTFFKASLILLSSLSLSLTTSLFPKLTTDMSPAILPIPAAIPDNVFLSAYFAFEVILASFAFTLLSASVKISALTISL